MQDTLQVGEPVELAPAVRRLLAPNGSFMTGPGTNTYLLGTSEIAVIDPGPAIHQHVERIIEVAGAPICSILVTHTHPDHSPAARELAGRTGARLYGQAAPPGAQQDKSFKPDRRLEDGDIVSGPGFELRAVHTPGHASNHLCFAWDERRWLFTGDHIMNGSTVVINPPDGNMNDYLRSLRRVAEMNIATLAPGHGDLLGEPRRVAEWIIRHRLEREAKIVEAVRKAGSATVTELVDSVYDDVPEYLHRVAQRSLLAHLLRLEEEGQASCSDTRWTLS